MTGQLDAIKVCRLTGAEPFHTGGASLDFDLLSFWQWACSDINGNALRGLVAEYLVARAVGGDGGVRTEWDAYDVVTPSGIKIEVKTSAYLQTWKQEKLSAIKFDIGRKRGWDATTNTLADIASRSADIYVFAVHTHQDKATLDPLDVNQWVFYVMPTTVLNEMMPTQKSIGLSSLLKLGPTKLKFEALGEAMGLPQGSTQP